MTKQQCRNYCYLFSFFSLVFIGFIVRTMIYEVGNKRIIFVSMFGFLVFMQLRLVLLMYRKSVDYK